MLSNLLAQQLIGPFFGLGAGVVNTWDDERHIVGSCGMNLSDLSIFSGDCISEEQKNLLSEDECIRHGTAFDPV